ncbi:hypothetical protein ACFV20_06955 [Streptomyces sp. NPDC059696]|uniref:hypothetical protein n=1 Tax=Streptomyces sp. NPDC059696 TaxID=3346911 RepID=UPI00367E561C
MRKASRLPTSCHRWTFSLAQGARSMARKISFVTSHSGVRPSFTAVSVLLSTEPLAIGEIWIS